ncbi:MAG: leucine--tRNA ligase [Corynebacterium sp.]|nr:leucine--tRNA ligase [Corynebacterium sp.]
MTDTTPAYRYTAELAGTIEAKWQEYWKTQGTFHTPNPVGALKPENAEQEAALKREKLFVQDMFPYPSGVGIHVGHPLGYIATDTYARFQRHNGKNVLHTLGYDAFGLPAEQFAIQTGTHPRETTEKNIANMERQIGRLGLGHDKRRAIRTIDPDYFRWTQWIFLTIYNSYFDTELNRARPISELEAQLRAQGLDGDELADAVDKQRLVYKSDGVVNWCPGLGTVLANEEVTADGRSERGNFPVFRKKLPQWMMRITAYADRLIDDLDLLDWPEKVKSMQRNWIGRSHGAEVDFTAGEHTITVFTTRPDTLFGATYMVLAPEHPLVDALTTADQADAVAAYRASVQAKSDLERQENKDKTGVFTGTYAVNPLSGAQVPVYIADYVLMGYGTGAIMAVPAHDQRDWDFAHALDLPIVEVIAGGDIATEAYAGDGEHINSGFLDGMNKADAIATAVAKLEADGTGHAVTQYKLRDWLFARQRYWGEPFPIVYDADRRAHALPESMLPVTLPEVTDYAPAKLDPFDPNSEPHPPLKKVTDWVNVELDLGDGLHTYTRDTNVMPQWAGSSWYQLRYIDPLDSEQLVAPENEKYWVGSTDTAPGGGVDLYVGGVEHAVLHLLYSRFWHKVLYDLGHVSSVEPYHRLFNQGYIQAYAYTDARGVYVPAAEVEEKDGKYFYQGEEVNREYGKMGKSLKNAISPDEVCDDFGADTLRVYEMSMGPLDMSRAWSTKDVIGAHRFLQRLWRLIVSETTGEVVTSADAPTEDDLRALNKTIAGVIDDYTNLRMNTVVAKLIEYVNYLTKAYGADDARVPTGLVEPLILMVSPLAPHLADELWEKLGHAGTCTYVQFPEVDEKYLVEDTVELPVQVNGRVRGRITVAADVADATGPKGTQEANATVLAAAREAVASNLDGKSVVKEIVVPGRMVNLVVK